MDLIKTELEKALNNSFPMRGLNRGWCYAGNFYVNDKVKIKKLDWRKTPERKPNWI